MAVLRLRLRLRLAEVEERPVKYMDMRLMGCVICVASHRACHIPMHAINLVFCC